MAPEPTHAVYIVSTICAAIFLLILPVRLLQLRNSSIKNSTSWHGHFKAALGLLLSTILSSYWAKVLSVEVEQKTDFLLSLFASIIATLGLSLLLIREQRRSLRPSDLATLYLLASLLCDIAYLTLPSTVAEYSHTSRLIFVRFFVYSVLLALECCTKRPESEVLRNHQDPEELHGILSRVLLTWINPILLRGYKSILVNQDMPNLSQDMKPEGTRTAILKEWSRCAKPKEKNSLLITLIKCLKWPFLAPVLPRLLLIVFRYSQPILIKESIRHVAAQPPGTQKGDAFWFIVSAVTIYVGLALSTSIYQNHLDRLKLMTRSALVGLIHDKMMKSPSIAYENGEATTLMSSDADSLDGIAEMVHETWAQVIEVLIGIRLLAGQVGWIWPLPLFLIYLCSHVSRFVARNLQPNQKAWNDATQNRIAAISSLLSALKTVKVLGLQNTLTNRIQELRQRELCVASKLRWVMVYYNASANALGMFTPTLTLSIFAVISVAHGVNLDSQTAFTTMAILSMVTHPANMVMTFVPRAVAALSGFERIQAFLLQDSLEADRATLPKGAVSNLSSDLASGQLKSPNAAIRVKQLKIGRGHLVLDNINIDVAAGSLTIISGPTGSGKSTLLRAILGEVVPAHGTISLSTQKIAYCAQRPWLPNGTIKEAIYGATDNCEASIGDHERWYHEVLNICSLTHDLDSLPDGDQTEIGSRGLNLSGGQRLRVTLARALLAKCDIILLDDIFSGLDGETERTVFDNLFGPTGLARRLNITVVLVSNSSQYFSTADHIVVLGDHKIIDQGKWQNIKIKAGSIPKFSANYNGKDSGILSTNLDKLNAQLQAKDDTKVDLVRQTGDPALYGYYLGFIDNRNLLYLVAVTASCTFFMTIPQYWLQLWTELGGSNTRFYILGFLSMSAISWASTSTQMWSVLIRIAPQSGLRLHKRLLYIVTNAPLSYLSKTDNGSILNKFSQDIQLIDKQIPSALQTVVTQILKLIIQIIVLCMAEKWLALSLPPFILLIYIVQKVYLRTSRQLRLLELESKAGVFSSFLESVEGLETIRSFGWSEAAIQENIQSLQTSQRPEFLLLCLQRWLNIVLDLSSAAVSIGIVSIAAVYRGHVSGAQVGIVLNIMLVANKTMLKLVENWTTLETSLGAIARLKTLEKTTPFEGGKERRLEPPQNWPSKGQVELTNITASYQSANAALRNLSLKITAGQKLIVCGRTGSGKSTLLLLLLQLLEPQSGKIELDGIDIRHVSLDLLRERCFIAVSQDSLILPNETLRFNLDSGISISDNITIAALAKTGLWAHFSGDTRIEAKTNTVTKAAGLHEQLILDRKVLSFKELSVGQCQLFALCRALVKASSLRNFGLRPVILLDEVTSSLDTTTEVTINRIINDEFTEQGHTVIIVAHRLGAFQEHTETRRDAVALLADGELREVIRDLESATFQRLQGMV